MRAFIALFLNRLKNLTRLERRRVDVTLTRIHRKPALMFIFNAFLLSINAIERARLVLLQSLRSMGVLSDEARHAGQEQLRMPLTMPAKTLPQAPGVLLVVEESIEQCFRYRVKQKLEQLASLHISADWVSWRDNAAAREKLHLNDIVIFYRVPGFPDVLKLIEYAHAINKVVVYDVDDLVFDRDRLAEKFKRRSGQLSAHERKAMLDGAALYRSALQACTFAITTTNPLRREIEKLLGERKVFLLPNALDDLLQAVSTTPRAAKDQNYIDVFYGSGTKTHDEDFSLVSGVLGRLLSEFDTLRLIIVGHLTLPEPLRVYRERVVELPIMSFESYLSVLSQADINIAPLEPGVFADCKSEIKWLEAGSFGIPSVVSSTSTYNSVIERGIDGFTAADEDDWYGCLHKLIVDEALRKQIGQRARESALEKYGTDVMSRNMSGIIDALLQKAVDNGTLSAVPANRRKLLFVNTVYPPNAVGGATVVMKNTIDEIRKNYGEAYEPLVFTCDGENPVPYQLSEYGWEGVPVTALSMPTHPDLEWKYRDGNVCRLFKKFLQYQQPDLIHFHSIQRLTGSLLQAAHETGIPFVVTVHDAWWLSDHQFLLDDEGLIVDLKQLDPIVAARTSNDIVGSLERTLYLRKQLARADELLAVSEYQADLYKQNGFSRVVVNKNGVDPYPGAATGNDATGKLRLGYVGGLCIHKGYYFLKQAVEESKLENIEIHIIDFDLAEGEQRDRQWGVSDIRFFPKLPAGGMREFYRNIEVLVAPSLWPESFGLVAREAVLLGRWVVASNAGGLAEDLLPGVNGHVFEMGDLEAFKKILTELNGNPDYYRQAIPLSIEAQGKVWSVSQQVRHLVGIYDKLLASGITRKNNSQQALARQAV